jgi:outer membrane receptor protein involved in Fe transport
LPWSGLVYVQSRQFKSSFATLAPSRLSARRVSLQYDVPGDAIGWSAEVRPRLDSRTELRFGLDGRRMSGESREFANYVADAPTRQREAGGRTAHDGVFAELSRQSEGLTLTAAVRADRWHIGTGRLVERSLASGAVTTNESYRPRSGWRPTGRIGASLALGPISLRGAAYAGWRLPTLNELFRPFRVGADATAANPLLDPERLRGAELGADLREGEWKFSATLFANRLVDPIANVTISNGPGVFPGVGFVSAAGAYRQRQNLEAIEALGVEAGGGWERGPWSLAANLSFTDAKVRASGVAAGLNGRRPAQSPSLSASARAGWESLGRSVELALHYEGRRFEDDLNQQRLPPAFVVDVASGLPLRKQVALTARIENLFNAKRIAAISGDGTEERSSPRTIWIGLRISPHGV